MATDPGFAAFVVEQAGDVIDVRVRRMFGGYALYVGEKVVGFLCDDQAFIKPTAGGRALAGGRLADRVREVAERADVGGGCHTVPHSGRAALGATVAVGEASRNRGDRANVELRRGTDDTSRIIKNLWPLYQHDVWRSTGHSAATSSCELRSAPKGT